MPQRHITARQKQTTKSKVHDSKLPQRAIRLRKQHSKSNKYKNQSRNCIKRLTEYKNKPKNTTPKQQLSKRAFDTMAPIKNTRYHQPISGARHQKSLQCQQTTQYTHRATSGNAKQKAIDTAQRTIRPKPPKIDSTTLHA